MKCVAAMHIVFEWPPCGLGLSILAKCSLATTIEIQLICDMTSYLGFPVHPCQSQIISKAHLKTTEIEAIITFTVRQILQAIKTEHRLQHKKGEE